MTNYPNIPHPAKFNDNVLSYIERPLRGYYHVLDPFAGTGKLMEIGAEHQIFLNEIEPEWARQGRADSVADARHLPYPNGFFDAVATSPCYGNRMADHHDAKDGSKRTTYRHCLGRPLHPANSGQLQWGQTYRDFHIEAWKECRRLLRPGGRFILNISDHIRKGERVEVSKWHLETLLGLGFILEGTHEVPTPRLRFGANGNLRVDHENVFVLRKR